MPADPRRQHVYTVAGETGEHRGPVTEHGHQIGGAATDDRTSLTMRPVGVGSVNRNPRLLPECRYERIRHGHLGVQYLD